MEEVEPWVDPDSPDLSDGMEVEGEQNGGHNGGNGGDGRT